MKQSTFLSSTFIACLFVLPSVFAYNRNQVQIDLNREKAKWESQGITDYDYKHTALHDTSGAIYPYSTQVRGGSVVSYRDGNNQEITWLKPSTMGNWFNLIQVHIDGGAQSIVVSYDSKRGFPATIDIVMSGGQVLNFRIFDFAYYQISYNPQAVQNELNMQRAKWEGMAIANYNYMHNTLSDNTPGRAYPFSTQVRNGAVVSYVDANNQPITWTKPQKLDIYFNVIQQYLDRNAQYIEVTYDPTRGFPTKVYVIENGQETFHAQVFNFHYFARRLQGGYILHQVQNELNMQRAKWEGMAITNYNYMHNTLSDKTPGRVYPFATQVRNGGVVSYVDGNNQPITFAKPQRLDIYFNVIQQYLDSGAEYIEATYDPTRGFPTRVYVVKDGQEVFHAQVFGFHYFTRRLRGADSESQ